jgi:hypothetical protein
VTGVPMHCPDELHLSPVVQASPSLHVAPVLTVYEQVPSIELQVPGLFWQVPGLVQVTAVPTHFPDELHTSPVVQALPSLHEVPTAAAAYEQVPVFALQVPGPF